jgi:hypothetical protein
MRFSVHTADRYGGFNFHRHGAGRRQHSAANDAADDRHEFRYQTVRENHHEGRCVSIQIADNTTYKRLASDSTAPDVREYLKQQAVAEGQACQTWVR